jgi:hypothetical protein
VSPADTQGDEVRLLATFRRLDGELARQLLARDLAREEARPFVDSSTFDRAPRREPLTPDTHRSPR